jgi:serine/threonine-protein kinase HipA
MANRARLPEQPILATAKQTVQRFREVWREERANLPLSKEVVSAVEHQLRVVPLAGA